MGRNNRNRGNVGKGFQPKLGETKIMFCRICKEKYGQNRTYHVWSSRLFSEGKWVCTANH
jgi:hypothetical protein